MTMTSERDSAEMMTSAWTTEDAAETDRKGRTANLVANAPLAGCLPHAEIGHQGAHVHPEASEIARGAMLEIMREAMVGIRATDTVEPGLEAQQSLYGMNGSLPAKNLEMK